MAFLERNANSGSVSTGFNIENSLKLETTNNEWLYRASPTAGNRKTHTFSFWIKRTTLGNPTASGVMYVIGQGQHGRMHFSSDYFQYRFDDGHDVRDVTIKHRDPAAWLHVVVSVDTNQSSSSNRVKIFFNGVQSTVLDFDGGSYPDIQDSSSGWFTTNYLTLGTAPFGGSYNAGDGDYDMSGYLAEFCAVDGTAYAPTDFGEFDEDSGIWKPKDVSELTFGSEGFYLNFSNASNLGEDFSGNDNDFASSNLSAADQATDTPTNNFATLNPLHMYSGTSSHNPTFKEGATRWTTGRAGYWAAGLASIGLTSGKWYFEAQPGTSNTHITTIGWGDESDINDWAQDQADTNGFPGENGTNSIGYLGSDTSSSYGNVWLGTGSTSNVNANYTISNIVGVAIDADNGFVYFAKDNTYVNSGNPGSGANGTGGYAFTDTTTTRTGTVFPAVGGYYHTAPTVINVNFGGFTTITISSAATDAKGYGTFEYAPPSGYYAICTKNLAEYG